MGERMKKKQLELMELEERKNLLINQLDVFAKKHKFNKNDFLENYLKNEIEKFILYELNLPYSCVRVDPGIKFISQIDSMVIKNDKSCGSDRSIN